MEYLSPISDYESVTPFHFDFCLTKADNLAFSLSYQVHPTRLLDLAPEHGGVAFVPIQNAAILPY